MPDIQTVSIIGGPGTGDGGVTPAASGAIVETPKGQPDIRLNVVRPIVAVFVRFGHLFLVTFSGVLGAAGISAAGLGPDELSNVLVATDLAGLLKNAAYVGLASASVGFVKDLITVFGRLESRYPLVTGSI